MSLANKDVRSQRLQQMIVRAGAIIGNLPCDADINKAIDALNILTFDHGVNVATFLKDNKKMISYSAKMTQQRKFF